MIEVIKKWSAYIVAVVLMLLLASTCINKAGETIAGEKNIYDKQLKRRVEILVTAKNKSDKTIDSLYYESAKKDKELARVRQEKIKVDSKISKLEKERQAYLMKVSGNTYKQTAEFIAKTYKAPKSVSYTNTGVTLSDSVPNKVAATIIEKSFLEGKLNLTEQKVTDTEKEVTVLESKVKNKDKEIESINAISKEKDLTLEASKNLNEATKKENKNLKRGRFVNRILIVAAFIGGILIAK